MGGRWVPSSFAQHVLNGPDGRPRPVTSAEALARDSGAVERFRVFSRAGVDAPTVLATDLQRTRPNGPLLDSQVARAHSITYGRPARRPYTPPTSRGYGR